MRYSRKVERAIVAQIEREPSRPVILPDWAYWKGDPQPWVYLDSQPIRLARHLYGLLVGELPPGAGLRNPPEIDQRNVNPHLMVVTPSRGARITCPNNHRYTEDDYIEGVGHRCQTCRAQRLLGTPDVATINRAKTHCPKNHPLVKRKKGPRRCLECPREATRAWRENQKREHA